MVWGVLMATSEKLTDELQSRLEQTKRLPWTRFPTVYEINTLVWINELSRKYKKRIDLSSVPPAEWDAISKGFDAVWLMGVWERSPFGTAVANRNPGLIADFKSALPDFTTSDNVGSPYCIKAYEVDAQLGGRAALAVARAEIARRGMKLLLDFVPNHVAPDHSWALEHPDYFVVGAQEDLMKDPASFLSVRGYTFALGRDPFFPAWPDVLQLNAFTPHLRQAAQMTVATIAEQCDGVRCDMAMLMLNSVFERTWGQRAGQRPDAEYWREIISAVKRKNPKFIFIAEAYWDLEWDLQQQGFDYCYDKKLYDRLEHENAESVWLHLHADRAYQDKLVRFIENHDEPRAAATFSPEKERASAVVIATIPGMRLFHQGQFEGRRVRVPVFLARWPHETPDRDQATFYSKLLQATARPVFKDGDWKLCERTGWPDNESFENLLAWTWTKSDERFLIAINLCDRPIQAQVQVPGEGSGQCKLIDLLSGATYSRDIEGMRSPGLYLGLGPWQFNFFQLVRSED